MDRHFDKVRRDLSKRVAFSAWTQVKGTTDSELVGALFFTHLSGGSGEDIPASKKITPVMMREAMVKAVTDVLSVSKEVLTDAEWKGAASSLNLAATDGKVLCALRYRNSETSQPPSLCMFLSSRIVSRRSKLNFFSVQMSPPPRA